MAGCAVLVDDGRYVFVEGDGLSRQQESCHKQEDEGSHNPSVTGFWWKGLEHESQATANAAGGIHQKEWTTVCHGQA